MVQRSALPLSKGKNYKVVTLCGSTRFKEQYMEVQKRLTFRRRRGLETRHEGNA